MTVSLWRRAASPHRLEADVAVIGAGICGLVAALHLHRRGIRVVVLERGTIGSGASLRNAGFLMRGAAHNYAAAVRTWGRPRAAALWRWSVENLAALRREGIESLEGYHPVPSCLLAFTENEASELRQSLDLLHQDGFDARWVDRADDDAWHSPMLRPRGGLLNPDDAVCHPREVLALLASRLPAPVLEHQEVGEIVPHNGGIEARTPDLLVRARHALLCTNAYAPLLLPILARVITPRRGQMMAIHADGARLQWAYYANFGSEYFRQVSEGVLIFGGFRTAHEEEEVGYDDRVTPGVQGDLERFARELLNRPVRVVARWSGTMGFSPDALPIIAPVPGPWEDGAVWFCGGFTGHGMSLGWRAATVAVDALLGLCRDVFPATGSLAGGL